VPISDDGGSSREILKACGGPSIGDIRSTLIRLMPESHQLMRHLLELRLSSENGQEALSEWLEILRETHPLIQALPHEMRAMMAPALLKFEQLRQSVFHFDLRNGSIGNFFLTGLYLEASSLEQAIALFAKITAISQKRPRVFPALLEQETPRIGVSLKDGTRLIGQSAISHPGSTRLVDKSDATPLKAPIERLFYAGKQNEPISYAANPQVIVSLQEAHLILYGIGSFWTSLAPSLILKGVGEAIAAASALKVGMVNSFCDREALGMETTTDYLYRLTDALNRFGELDNSPRDYCSHLFIVEGSSIQIERPLLEQWQIEVCSIPKDLEHSLSFQEKAYPSYRASSFIEKIAFLLNKAAPIDP
jgi:2-phospho-L-lactate transferase/gluconeogenesis factor (CofD/UPF0052 family)